MILPSCICVNIRRGREDEGQRDRDEKRKQTERAHRQADRDTQTAPDRQRQTDSEKRRQTDRQREGQTSRESKGAPGERERRAENENGRGLVSPPRWHRLFRKVALLSLRSRPFGVLPLIRFLFVALDLGHYCCGSGVHSIHTHKTKIWLPPFPGPENQRGGENLR